MKSRNPSHNRRGQLLKSQITKNIVVLDDKHANQWLSGNDLDINIDRGWKF